jgi:hypothetical protein
MMKANLQLLWPTQGKQAKWPTPGMPINGRERTWENARSPTSSTALTSGYTVRPRQEDRMHDGRARRNCRQYRQGSSQHKKTSRHGGQQDQDGIKHMDGWPNAVNQRARAY